MFIVNQNYSHCKLLISTDLYVFIHILTSNPLAYQQAYILMITLLRRI